MLVSTSFQLFNYCWKIFIFLRLVQCETNSSKTRLTRIDFSLLTETQLNEQIIYDLHNKIRKTNDIIDFPDYDESDEDEDEEVKEQEEDLLPSSTVNQNTTIFRFESKSSGSSLLSKFILNFIQILIILSKK